MSKSTHRNQPKPSRRTSEPRTTPALSAIAAAMNGVDPEPQDIAALAQTSVTPELLHQAAALALGKAMRPHLVASEFANRTDRTGPAPEGSSVDACHLAESLIGSPGEDRRLHADQIGAAMLLGAMQIRFLEAVCTQIEVHMLTPELSVPHQLPARSVLKNGGNLAPGIRLLADHSAGGDRSAVWLHALSTITVAGIAGRAVVDAGPGKASAQRAARLAAPVSVTPAVGLWPVNVVQDCLRIAASAVRRWVAAMPRELCGPDDRDIMLRTGPALRDFLVSPAIAALTGEAGSAPVVPLRAAPGGTVIRTPREVLETMRLGGVLGEELSEVVELPAGYRIGEMYRDELAALSVAEVEDLPDEVEVTVNFPVPEWKNVTALVEGAREARAITLTAPVLAWTNRDVVAGQLHRISLRARVRRGVVCESVEGLAVLLAEGTTFTVLGIDTSRGHTTLYGIQAA